MLNLLLALVLAAPPAEPDTASGWIADGKAHFENGRFRPAVAAFSHAIELDRELALAWRWRSAALSRLGDWPGAVRDGDRAVELAPNWVYAWMWVAWAKVQVEDHLGALAAYTRAAELDPQRMEAWRNRAAQLRTLGRLEEALAAYDRALEVAPDDAFNLLWRARTHRELGHPAEAARDLERAAALGDGAVASDARKELADVQGRTASSASPSAEPAPGASRPRAAGATPEQIVQAAFQAQARGDVAGFLALCDPEAGRGRDGLEALLRQVAGKLAFEAPAVEVLATGLSRQGNQALVRVRHRVRVRAGGDSAAAEGGTLVLLRRVGPDWRIRLLQVDPLLGLERAVAKRAAAARPAAHVSLAFPARSARFLSRAAGPAEGSPVIDVAEVNRRFSEAVRNTRFDEFKLVLDGGFTALDFAPGGRPLALGYQALDLARTYVSDLPRDLAQSNWGAAGLDAVQVALGLAQFLAKPVPGADKAGAVLGVALEQWKYNLVQQHSFDRIRLAVLQGGAEGAPRYLLLVEPEAATWPRDLHVVPDPAWPLAGVAPRAIAFLSDRAAREGRLRFAVGSVFRVVRSESEDLYEAARTLVPFGVVTKAQAGVTPDWVASIPLGLTSRFEREVTIGAAILDRFEVQEGALRAAVSCERGEELVLARLTDGTLTRPLLVANRAFSEVDAMGLSRSGTPLARPTFVNAGGRMSARMRIAVPAGQSLSGLEVVGSFLEMESRAGLLPPILTGLPAAASLGIVLQIGDPSVLAAKLSGTWPRASLSLSGLRPGITTLTLLLPERRMSLPDLDLLKGDPDDTLRTYLGNPGTRMVPLREVVAPAVTTELEVEVGGAPGGAVSEETFQVGSFDPGRPATRGRFRFRHTWTEPPPELVPGAALDLRIAVEELEHGVPGDAIVVVGSQFITTVALTGGRRHIEGLRALDRNSPEDLLTLAPGLEIYEPREVRAGQVSAPDGSTVWSKRAETVLDARIPDLPQGEGLALLIGVNPHSVCRLDVVYLYRRQGARYVQETSFVKSRPEWHQDDRTCAARAGAP